MNPTMSRRRAAQLVITVVNTVLEMWLAKYREGMVGREDAMPETARLMTSLATLVTTGNILPTGIPPGVNMYTQMHAMRDHMEHRMRCKTRFKACVWLGRRGEPHGHRSDDGDGDHGNDSKEPAPSPPSTRPIPSLKRKRDMATLVMAMTSRTS
ncbi:hypothetical protein H257_13644 [Aphanomyces astaci]|uniref:Uncharacterized protein n=1 Tax=Aphanomyces astaci TaxID=112090 RepID=W4FTS2_APHAT|nr:hypothetical protein H257_13644 [Aphanomyces astaci]ETV70867.1 hypothetical protein H257_13644 [Aphanomyces astaci]|eukprot:XP_009839530.1 hypothetical protein H257_13644 [Aphanomyces astaci]